MKILWRLMCYLLLVVCFFCEGRLFELVRVLGDKRIL